MWFIIALILFVVGLFSSFFMPLLVSLVRFQTETKIGFSPGMATYWYAIIAFTMLSLGFYLIYRLRKNRNRVIGGFLGIGLFAISLLCAFNSYTYVDEGYIQFGNGIITKKYHWEDVKEFYFNSDGRIDWYELVMEDGKKYEVVFGGLLNTAPRNHIRRSVEANGVKMIDISK